MEVLGFSIWVVLGTAWSVDTFDVTGVVSDCVTVVSHVGPAWVDVRLTVSVVSSLLVLVKGSEVVSAVDVSESPCARCECDGDPSNRRFSDRQVSIHDTNSEVTLPFF